MNRFFALFAAIVIGIALAPLLLRAPVQADPLKQAILGPIAGKDSISMASDSKVDQVYVRVMQADGRLSPIVRQPKLVLSEEEWRARLTPEQFRILRYHGTEPPFCGGLLENKVPGIYACAGCQLPLFPSTSKFDSGTGWPSFFAPLAAENILERVDSSHGMVRTEILCRRCGGHLGHVFNDGPKPSGLRYCLNSEALQFVANNELGTIAEEVTPAEVAELVVAGGCFWCVEAVFEELAGVIDAVSGYSGGKAEDANYKAVSSGMTTHAEAVKIIYDPAIISRETLLRVHFATHDPTTLNRQGNDVGPHYRSAIFYANEEEKAAARQLMDELAAEGVFGRPIVTTLEPLTGFYRAEEYHQNFVCRNPRQGYVRAVALPKVEKLRQYLGGQ
jgi:peptide methionine sulfoxide reductase msrA/msrB